MSEHTLNSDLWRNVFPSSGDSYNLSFLDLHTYYVHGPGHHGHGALNHHHHNHHHHPHFQHGGLGGGLDVTLEDYSEARQGLALDLAQSAVSSSSSLLGGGGGGGFGSWGGNASGSGNMSLGLSLRGFNPSPVGTIRQRTSGAGSGAGREKTPIPERFVAPSQTVSTVNGELSALGVVGVGVDDHGHDGDDGAAVLRKGGGGSSKDSATTTTTRTRKPPQTRSGNGALGRSMSHHRGQSQSAVCPQDLMLRNDNKRKRASWDGGMA
ncbi:hypothetical protein CVT25_009279 [Psilocybe cyanescens]|uniref:Uncharacterized protein n=1 Tax=Psilocybe cyanescens TaxID=93625 RepID=A0A409WW86_PSICY|nr:hypothetical protein CVT25_009279 [Psilocybe cyanescens]